MRLKNNTIFAISCATTLLLFSCGSNSSKQQRVINTPQFGVFSVDSIGNIQKDMIFDISKTETIELDFTNIEKNRLDNIEEVKIITLEMTNNSMLRGIAKVLYNGKNYYVLDDSKNKRVIVFDTNGKFVTKVGDTGRGVGEYVRIYDFAITNKEVVLLDGDGHKIMFYDLSGKYKESLDLNIMTREIYATVNPDEFIIKTGDNRHIEELYGYQLLKINRNGKILSKTLKLPPQVPFTVGVNGHFNNGRVTFHSSLSNLIHEIYNDTISVKYQLDFMGKGLPNDFQEICNGDFEKFNDNYWGKYRYLIGNYASTENHLLLCLTTEKNRNVLFVHNIKSGKSMAISPAINFGEKEFDVSGLVSCSIPTGISVYGDEFIGAISPDIITNLNKYPSKLKELTGDTKEIEVDNNPYIVKFKLTK